MNQDQKLKAFIAELRVVCATRKVCDLCDQQEISRRLREWEYPK